MARSSAPIVSTGFPNSAARADRISSSLKRIAADEVPSSFPGSDDPEPASEADGFPTSSSLSSSLSSASSASRSLSAVTAAETSAFGSFASSASASDAILSASSASALCPVLAASAAISRSTAAILSSYRLAVARSLSSSA